jgi:hypothetical protein
MKTTTTTASPNRKKNMEVRPEVQPHDGRRRKGLNSAQDVPKGSQWLFHHAKKTTVAPTTTTTTTSLFGTTGKIHEDRQQLNTITMTTTTKKVVAIITFLALASWSNLVVYDSTAVWLDTHRQLHREETLWFRPPPPPPPATAALSLSDSSGGGAVTSRHRTAATATAATALPPPPLTRRTVSSSSISSSSSATGSSDQQQLQQQSPQSQQSPPSSQQRRRDLVQLAIQHRESSSANNITAAVCFKTLFGTIDLGIVIQWAGACCIEIFVAFLLCCVRCRAFN